MRCGGGRNPPSSCSAPWARAAISGPVGRWSELAGERVDVEEALVEAVLDEVAVGRVDLGAAGRGGVGEVVDNQRIEAPFLQLVMERLWDVERTAGSSALRLATLRELGGAEAIVRAHLERALAELSAAQKDVAASMFDHLVTPSGTKIAHRVGDLAQYAHVDEAKLAGVLEALGRERILRSVGDANGGGPQYEIFHDVLAQSVVAWSTQRELERTRREAARRHRRLVVLAAAALIALAAMTAVAIFALAQRSEARRERATARTEARRAGARALEATAVSDLEVDPQHSLSLALSAARRSPSRQAETVLRNALLASRVRGVIRASGPIVSAAFSGDGRRILVADRTGAARVY